MTYKKFVYRQYFPSRIFPRREKVPRRFPPRCETRLPQRPLAANFYYNPLAAHAHPPVPAFGVLYQELLCLCRQSSDNAFLLIKHRKQDPEDVHRQLEGCNRNLRPKVAVAMVFHCKGIFTVLNVLGGNKMA